MIRIFTIILGILVLALADARFFAAPFSPRPQPIEERITVSQQEPAAATSTAAVPSSASSTDLTRLNLVRSDSEEKEQAAAKPVLPILVPSPVLPSIPLVPQVAAPIPAPATQATTTPVFEPPPALKPELPPLDIAAIFAAVVKIECPSEDQLGKYVGSGFVLHGNVIVTAAHLLMVSGTDTCTVIFPNKDRAPSHWLTAAMSESREVIRKRHDEQGIDVATLSLALLADYPEARAVFGEKYPAVPYPVCEDPDMIGDKLLHFGYPSNFLNQSYLSSSEGEVIAYADIKGIETLLNQDQTGTYKSPIFSYVTDAYNLHPYMVSRVATFYGDSGGLAFNKTKQCILGPQRGGTTGGGAGENVSIFPLLGWKMAKILLP